TANGLALDILRFLSDEPVSATPPTAGYRFRKFARRNKSALGVAALTLTVLLAATGVSLWQAREARGAAGEALAARSDATEKQAAERIAREESQRIARFLIEVFESPDPGRDGRTVTVVETL